MGEKEWQPVCEHVKKTELDYLEKESIINVEVEKIVISLGGSNSDSDTSKTDIEDEEEGLSGIEELE